MKRGRKEKPTALKLLTNNPGNRPLKENEPVSAEPPVVPACLMEPEHARALAIWTRNAAWLELNGLLTAQTSDAYATYCLMRAEFERDPAGMPTSRIAEMRKNQELFHLVPNGIRPSEAKSDDTAAEFFGT